MTDGKEHQGLPVAGYQSQSQSNVNAVNLNKQVEELVLRRLAEHNPEVCDPRWLAIARTHFEEGFMALNRAVFKPRRLEGNLADMEPLRDYLGMKHG